jgi:hypothetical protein
MPCVRLAPLVALAFLSPGADAALAQASELEPGRWKLHVASTTNGNADPARDTEECLEGSELKDLGAYFAPTLEGVQARCERTRLPASDPHKVDYRARCTGAGFTWEATSSVTVDSASGFTATVRMETRTQRESAVVVAEIAGTRVGPCLSTATPPGAAPAPPGPAP